MVSCSVTVRFLHLPLQLVFKSFALRNVNRSATQTDCHSVFEYGLPARFDPTLDMIFDPDDAIFSKVLAVIL